MRVAIYCRISLDAKGERLGVERQEAECRAFSQQRGWEVVRVYVDNDISATSGAVRPAFSSLLDDVATYDAIVVWHPDRLVRLSTDLERVIELGVNIHAVHAGNFDLSNPSGRAVAKTLVVWSQYEVEQKGLRQRSANRQKAVAGKPFWNRTAPIGYTKDGQVEPIGHAALRKAYADVLAGRTLYSISKEWVETGLASDRGGKDVWRPTSVKRILMHPRNAGIATLNGEEVGQGQWEPVVDRATWEAACAVLKSSTKGSFGRRSESLLVGVMVCGVCDRRINTARRRGVWHYRCNHAQCGGSTGAKEDVEAIVHRRLLAETTSPEFVEWWTLENAEGAEGLRLLEAESLALQGRLDEASELYATGVIDAMQLGDITKRVRGEREALEGRRETFAGVTLPVSAFADIEAMSTFVDELDMDRHRDLLRNVFSRVALLPRGKGARLMVRVETVPKRKNPHPEG